ncbi:histone-lysine N-methyltransferase 2B-like [Prorops nasuta]|uniref:histone-lysine N-methyltransferase 2B-like n=1 Tax=Prorops nasuta TaxID=863751 RepID=UPI0034CE8CFE
MSIPWEMDLDVRAAGNRTESFESDNSGNSYYWDSMLAPDVMPPPRTNLTFPLDCDLPPSANIIATLAPRPPLAPPVEPRNPHGSRETHLIDLSCDEIPPTPRREVIQPRRNAVSFSSPVATTIAEESTSRLQESTRTEAASRNNPFHPCSFSGRTEHRYENLPLAPPPADQPPPLPRKFSSFQDPSAPDRVPLPRTLPATPLTHPSPTPYQPAFPPPSRTTPLLRNPSPRWNPASILHSTYTMAPSRPNPPPPLATPRWHGANQYEATSPMARQASYPVRSNAESSAPYFPTHTPTPMLTPTPIPEHSQQPPQPSTLREFDPYYLNSSHLSETLTPEMRAWDSLTKYIPVFTGQFDEDPREFLASLHELIQGRNLAAPAVLRALPSALAGTALTWFRLESPAWTGYYDFVKAFCKTFAVKYPAHVIRREATARTQGPQERPLDFIMKIRRILGRMDPPMELEQQLDLAYHNLLPLYRQKIAREELSSFQDLINECHRVDTRRLADRSKHPPPPLPSASLFPTEAYNPLTSPRNPAAPIEAELTLVQGKEPTLTVTPSSPTPNKPSSPTSPQSKPSKSPRNKPAKIPQNSTPPSLPNTPLDPNQPLPGSPATGDTDFQKMRPPPNTCWNCHRPGHHFPQCSHPRGKFCCRCGRMGTVTKTCPNCKDKPSPGNE